MIKVLWPTVRIHKMLATRADWLAKASGAHRIEFTYGVNTEADAKLIFDALPQDKVLVTGVERRGPTWPVFKMGQTLEAEKDDIVIVISDDFFGFVWWDDFVVKELAGIESGLMCNDGIQKRAGRAMTLPIMTYSALLALNRTIYHPAYHWEYSDNELFENLTALGMLKETRDRKIYFRHDHWSNGSRSKDDHDRHCNLKSPLDKAMFATRMKLPLSERLKHGY